MTQLDSFTVPFSVINDYDYADNEDIVNITIPNGIKRIGNRAFLNCKNLKTITLPETLESIGNSAFCSCINLEEIVLPKNLKTIGYRAFADCKRLKKVVIEEGVEQLDWAIFSGCENLESITLPNSIKNIDKQLFLNCKKLKKVVLPKNITTLPDEFFKGCNNLDIVLDDNIKKLGNRTFEDCYKLSTFPDHISDFGDNCFKNCKNIESVYLNSDIQYLPDGMFDGCINLNKITYENNKTLKIGKRCFRNCKSLTKIPNWIGNYNVRAFENCTGLTSISIKFKTIPTACFRGCKNIEQIANMNKIKNIESFAFSGCEKLILIKLSTDVIASEAFSNCKKLRMVILDYNVSKINSRAFFNCESLNSINLMSSGIKYISKEAFYNCKNITSLEIPSTLRKIHPSAFRGMDSLYKINVSIYSEAFTTIDNKSLININNSSFVLYAKGCKDKSYSLKNYCLTHDENNKEVIRPITNIGMYAFEGAKNLEELTICSCVENIFPTSFMDCNNLKKLTIESIPFFRRFGLKIYNKNDLTGYANTLNILNPIPSYIPFEEIEIKGYLGGIDSYSFKDFKNVKNLILSDDIHSICNGAFSDCSLLEEVIIPNGVNTINKGAFNPATKLKFSNGLESKGFVELIHSSQQYIGDYKLYVFDDGTYYIDQGDKITKITKQQIDKICSKSEAIRDNPVLFLDFMNDLTKHDLEIKQLFNGILMSTMSLENRSILFNNLNKDDSFFLYVLKESKILDNLDNNTEMLLSNTNFQNVVDYINVLRKYNITNPLLCNKLFMAHYNIKKFERLIENDLNLFTKVVLTSHLLEKDNIMETNENYEHSLTLAIFKNDTLENYINLVKKYDIKDNYLFNKAFITVANNPLLEDLFKIYDANTKRLLKASLVMENNLTVTQNLNDLLILMKIVGALEEDPIIRQKASTFITEKIFEEYLPNGEENQYRIIEDDIHRFFNFHYLRDEFDSEFSTFFLENYRQLMDKERSHSGFIERVYLNFRQISKTSTSDKGSQRKLKVTLYKCENYLSNVKFDGVNEEDKDLAKLIGKWYDTNNAWLNALKIYKESLQAPRNIFTKIEIDENDNKTFDMDSVNDLKEDNTLFSYHWLPKQDYDNLVLGKYCNCCAHVNGAGQGIMRASMILDCCQNLVIKNNEGEIVSKSTLYVNKEQGYAVFNNVETSVNYRNNEYLEEIYNAFLRGAKAFVEIYNSNNEIPITKMSIGTNRNTILNFLTDENNHPSIPIQDSLKFGDYSLNGSGYSGDWESGQRLVLKKEIR